MDTAEEIQYLQVLAGPKAEWTKEGMKVTLMDGVTGFYVPAREMLSLREFINGFMKRYGAHDVYGREIIDPESGNP